MAMNAAEVSTQCRLYTAAALEPASNPPLNPARRKRVGAKRPNAHSTASSNGTDSAAIHPRHSSAECPRTSMSRCTVPPEHLDECHAVAKSGGESTATTHQPGPLRPRHARAQTKRRHGRGKGEKLFHPERTGEYCLPRPRESRARPTTPERHQATARYSSSKRGVRGSEGRRSCARWVSSVVCMLAVLHEICPQPLQATMDADLDPDCDCPVSWAASSIERPSMRVIRIASRCFSAAAPASAPRPFPSPPVRDLTAEQVPIPSGISSPARLRAAGDPPGGSARWRRPTE